MSAGENAEALITLARHDVDAVALMLDKRFAEEIFGFHAQQALEKALKAWLVASGADYPKTHDLRILVRLLQANGQDTDLCSDLVDLTI